MAGRTDEPHAKLDLKLTESQRPRNGCFAPTATRYIPLAVQTAAVGMPRTSSNLKLMSTVARFTDQSKIVLEALRKETSSAAASSSCRFCPRPLPLPLLFAEDPAPASCTAGRRPGEAAPISLLHEADRRVISHALEFTSLSRNMCVKP